MDILKRLKSQVILYSISLSYNSPKHHSVHQKFIYSVKCFANVYKINF